MDNKGKMNTKEAILDFIDYNKERIRDEWWIKVHLIENQIITVFADNSLPEIEHEEAPIEFSLPVEIEIAKQLWEEYEDEHVGKVGIGALPFIEWLQQ